ncbi:MAG: right-handed parallel beta-helix repeat-containing protein [Flavobacteriales bacterium]
MKKIAFTLLAFLSMLGANATVYTVNNEVGFAADYVTVQQAVNAALDGDTIYIQPSSLSYASFNLNKRLFLLGAGHNPEFSPYNAALTTTVLQTGSTGSVIKGVHLNSVTSAASTVINDIVISGCYFYALNLSSSGIYNNWILEGNIIYCAGTNGANFNYTGANFILRNNIFYKPDLGYFFYGTPAGAVIDHNLFLFSPTNGAFYGMTNGSGANVTVRNNIFYAVTSGSMNPIDNGCNCSFQNNMSYSPNQSFPNMPGNNMNNTDPEFIDPVYYFTYNANYRLEDTSLGADAATDGSDVGLYGGIFNFSQDGFDGGTPRVGTFTLQTSSAPQGGTITINLKAHGSGQ